jgi:hypothetical protein
MSNTNSFLLTAQTVQNIIASRSIVKQSQAQQGMEQTVRFHIQGNGFTIPVTDKSGAQVMDRQTNQPLFKVIYGCKVNSHVAMLNPINRAILTEAIKAETDGDTEKAHNLFNQYLNKIQVSFSVILNHNRVNPTFTDKQLVEAECQLIVTENGSLLTFQNVRPVAVAKLGKTPEFSLSDLMSISNEGPKAEDVFAPIEGVTDAATTADAEQADRASA